MANLTPQAPVVLEQAAKKLHDAAPAGHALRLAVASVANTSPDTDAIVSIHAVPSGGTAQNDNVIHRFKVGPNRTHQIGRGQDFPAGTEIWGSADVDTIAVAHVSALPVEV